MKVMPAFIQLFIVLMTTSIVMFGCVSPIPLYDVKYSGAVTVMSSETVKVQLASIDLPRYASKEIFIPAVTTGPDYPLQFHVRNQRAFVIALRKELVRLHIFKSTVGLDSHIRTDFTITINFTQTHHDVDDQVYTLHAKMELSGGKLPYIEEYRVISSVEDSTWEKWNTTAYQGKEKAVKRLLEKLIPAIEVYLKEAHKPK